MGADYDDFTRPGSSPYGRYEIAHRIIIDLISLAGYL